MAETYCGKSCADCGRKEVLNCPGCMDGPGKSWDEPCELAKCCRDKGHEECQTCNFHVTCGTLRGRDTMPEVRLRQREREVRKREALAKNAPLLGQWLWLWFWLQIVGILFAFMSNETVVGVFPVLYWPGQIFNLLISAGIAYSLFQLAEAEPRYRTAAICGIVGVVSGLVTMAVTRGSGEAPTWTMLYTIPAMVIGLVGDYNQYQANAAVLRDADPALSEKWLKLWNWYIGMTLGLFACLLVLMLIPGLGLFLFIADLIGLVVVGIVELVYLYRTANLFREFQG